MVGRRFVSFRLALFSLSIFPPAADALQQNEADEDVKSFLSSQKTETEGANLKAVPLPTSMATGSQRLCWCGR